MLIAALALVVAGAVAAPAASAQPRTTQNVGAVVVAARPAAPGVVVSVPPARIADPRTALLIPGAVRALGTVVVKLTGLGGIPAVGVTSVLGTVTVVDPQQAGYVTLWPAETVRPGTSSVNSRPGRPLPTRC